MVDTNNIHWIACIKYLFKSGWDKKNLNLLKKKDWFISWQDMLSHQLKYEDSIPQETGLQMWFFAMTFPHSIYVKKGYVHNYKST